MMRALGVYGCHDLAVKWWQPLQDAGYDIVITPPLSEETDPQSNGDIYRNGSVSKNGITVGIIATCSLNSVYCELDGQPAVFVTFGAWSKKMRLRKYALAEEIIDFFVKQGAKRLYKANAYQEARDLGNCH